MHMTHKRQTQPVSYIIASPNNQRADSRTL
jgi:hypothetical protein